MLFYQSRSVFCQGRILSVLSDRSRVKALHRKNSGKKNPSEMVKKNQSLLDGGKCHAITALLLVTVRAVKIAIFYYDKGETLDVQFNLRQEN